jgi:hypothetical protein
MCRSTEKGSGGGASGDQVNCSIFGVKNLKKKRFNKEKYLAKHNAVFDALDLVAYEEVRHIMSKLFNIT